MGQRYNLKAGMIFSLSIALLATVLPRLIRLDLERPGLVLINCTYLFVSFFFCWLVHHFFLEQKFLSPLLSRRGMRVVLSLTISALIIAGVSQAFRGTGLTSFSGLPLAPVRPGRVFLIRLFRSTVISLLCYFAVYYFRLQVMLQQSKIENEYLEQENLKAQLASLRQQISPHFLFNSLNTLSTLSHEQNVKDHILRMSDVYRYILQYQERREVPVHEELAFIRSYIYLLESRFESSLCIVITVNPDNLHRKILPFSLQLLVENAIKHNTISFTQPLAIDIYDRNGHLIVENDLRPKEAWEKPSGTGLQNLSRRYQLQTGMGITVTRKTEKFKVEIPFFV